MGFGREARRVRDSSLPTRYRLHALGSSIEMAQPIGFNATWSYLQEKVGRPWRDPEFLLPAIGLLEAERAIHLTVVHEYADTRREQKAAGLRGPRRGEVTPDSPLRWHGDERLGAIHTLRTWRERRTDRAIANHPKGRVVSTEVDRILLAPAQAVTDVESLQSALEWSRRQIDVIGWEADPTEYRVAWVLTRLLGQIHLRESGAGPLGNVWNFTTR